MAGRRLSESEASFIQDSLHKKNVDKTEKSNRSLDVRETRKKSDKPVRFWRNPTFWSSIVMFFPVVTTLVMAWMDYRAKAFLGDSIVWLNKQGLTAEFVQMVKSAGMSWLPKFIELYPYRWYAVGAVWIIAMLVIGVIMYIDYRKYQSSKSTETDVEDDKDESDVESQ